MDNDTIFTLICGNKIDCRSRDSSLVPVVTTEEGAALANVSHSTSTAARETAAL